MVVRASPRTCKIEGCDGLVVLSGASGRPPSYCPEHRDRSRRRSDARINARRRAHRAHLRELADRRPLAQRLAAVLAEVAARRATGPPIERTVCGCGRDYLTVPLEEAHTCPQPRHGGAAGLR